MTLSDLKLLLCLNRKKKFHHSFLPECYCPSSLRTLTLCPCQSACPGKALRSAIVFEVEEIQGDLGNFWIYSQKIDDDFVIRL